METPSPQDLVVLALETVQKGVPVDQAGFDPKIAEGIRGLLIKAAGEVFYDESPQNLAMRALRISGTVAEMTNELPVALEAQKLLLFLAGKTTDEVKTTVDIEKNPDVEFQLEGKLEVSKLWGGERRLSKEEAQVYCDTLNTQLQSGEKLWRFPNLEDFELFRQNKTLFKCESLWGYNTSCDSFWFGLEPDGDWYNSIDGDVYSVRLVRDM